MKIAMQPPSEMVSAWARIGIVDRAYASRIVPLLQAWERRAFEAAAEPPSWWMAL